MAEQSSVIVGARWASVLCACVLASCANVEEGTGGSGGSGGSIDGGNGGIGGSPAASCGQTTPEDNDMVDEVNAVGTGTLNGTCTIVDFEVLGCDGPDLLDEVFVTANEDGPVTVDLEWENGSSDLDLAIWSLPPECESVALSVNRAGTTESVSFTLAAGTEVVVSILAVDTNGSPEPYTVTLR